MLVNPNTVLGITAAADSVTQNCVSLRNTAFQGHTALLLCFLQTVCVTS